MTAKLNQIIALQVGKKTTAKEALTSIYHQMQKPELMTGISRTYKPRDEDGEQLPPESKRVQVNAMGLIKQVAPKVIDMLDVTATQDAANTIAKANVVVDGKVVLPDVPVTTLLFLEKQLMDLHTLIEKLPVLDPSEQWTYNDSQDCWASDPSSTIRSKKVPRPFVKYEATEHHPAQVDVVNEDVSVGTWTTVKYSGAVQASERNEMFERVRELQDAVKVAREEANSIVIKSVKIGEQLLKFVFGDKI